MASQEIEALSQALARLPGLGPRSARRAVLHLMKKRETALQPLLAALQSVSENLSTCSICGNVDTSDPCSICRDPKRDEKMLCVVEEVVTSGLSIARGSSPGAIMSSADVFPRSTACGRRTSRSNNW